MVPLTKSSNGVIDLIKMNIGKWYNINWPKVYSIFISSPYSVKSFKNVFFTEKEEMIKKIQFFLNNESWYEEHGIPYMFGLLLHGEPGCGKTSTIKAIAKVVI